MWAQDLPYCMPIAQWLAEEAVSLLPIIALVWAGYPDLLLSLQAPPPMDGWGCSGGGVMCQQIISCSTLQLVCAAGRGGQ